MGLEGLEDLGLLEDQLHLGSLGNQLDLHNLFHQWGLELHRGLEVLPLLVDLVGLVGLVDLFHHLFLVGLVGLVSLVHLLHLHDPELQFHQELLSLHEVQFHLSLQ